MCVWIEGSEPSLEPPCLDCPGHLTGIGRHIPNTVRHLGLSVPLPADPHSTRTWLRRAYAGMCRDPQGDRWKAERTFKCQVDGCSRMYKTRRAVTAHMSLCRGPDALVCSRMGCGRRFKYPKALETHEKRCGGRGKLEPCPVKGCGRSFKYKTSRDAHVQRCEGPSRMVRVCPVAGCTRTFGHRCALRAHIRWHLVPRRPCLRCKGASIFYGTQDEMTRHVRDVHEVAQCPEAGCTFRGTMGARRRHARIVHRHIPE